jgi:hypothetical protein
MTHFESQAIFLTSFFLPERPGTLPPGFWRSRKKKGGPNWLRVFVFLTFTGIAASASHGQAILQFSPAAANFGNVEIGSSKTIQVTITNTGSKSTVLTRENLVGDMYTASGFTPPMLIAPGGKVVISIKFQPTNAGSAPGSVIVGSGESVFGRDITHALLNYSLSGTGVAAATLDATPINVAFGSVPVGTSISKSVQLMNYGTQSATIAGARLSGAGFSTSGLTLPMRLAAGSTKTFTLKFAPTGTGTNSGTITLTSVFGGNPLTLSMSGTGIKPKGAGSPPPNGTGSPSSSGTGSPPPSGPGVSPAAHSVFLSWNASTSSDIVGYNVYRATSSSTTYAILANSPLLNYTDETVQAGQTYTYVVTAVNSAGEESVHSGSVTAVIP